MLLTNAVHMLCKCYILTVDWVCLHQANNGHFVFGALQNAFLCEVTNMYTGKVNVYTLLKGHSIFSTHILADGDLHCNVLIMCICI